MFNLGQRTAAGRAGVVLSALILASGCSVVGGSTTELRPVATNPYGLGRHHRRGANIVGIFAPA